MRRHLRTIRDKYRNLKKWQRISWLLVLVLLGILLFSGGNSDFTEISEIGGNAKKEVIIKSVGSLSLDTEPLELIGRVQSESQVDIRTESQGSILGVYKKLGDFISEGEVIAEIENSSQRANVEQARSLLDVQRAALSNLKNSVTSSGKTIAVENAYRALLSTGLVAEPQSANQKNVTPPVISGAYDGPEGIYDIRIERGEQFQDFEFYLKGIEKIRQTEIIKSELKSTNLGTYGLRISFKEEIPEYLETRWLVRIPNLESASYAANLSAYNAAIDSQRSLDSQIRAQESQVRSAQANLDASLAQLEKTIIRSPIAGTINVLDLDRGDFVSTFQLVASVANENETEIKTYVSENDKKSIIVGLPVIISGKYTGVVTSVSPAVDPATKKVEVSIGFDDGQEIDLLNGQSAKVTLTRDEISINEIEQIYIPLSALKVTSEGVVVFYVNSESVVEKIIVKEGPLVGDKVLIVSGLTPEMEIITDVRGISEGDVVTVAREKVN